MGIINAKDFEAMGLKKTLIVISGPTASGKTDLSLRLSEFADIEIISADSRQVFKYLNIGTAKPSAEEMMKVKHNLIDFLELTDYYSAGVFGREATEIANKIILDGKIPVVVGGSGLYIRSLTEGFFDDDTENDQGKLTIRAELTSKLESIGKEALFEELNSVDTESAFLYSDRNPRRVIRALEYFYFTGKKLSESQKNGLKRSEFDVISFTIEMEREKLYSLINQRSENMWHNGIIEEAKWAIDAGYSPELNSLNTVGYKEAISYLNRELSSDEALEKLKMNTRRYAKRQSTWFKKYSGGISLNEEPDNNIKKILNHLGSLPVSPK